MLKTTYRVLSKEPVLLGAAAVAVFEAAAPDASSAWKLAAGAIVAWGVRVLSTPTSKVAAQVETAKYVGAMEHQALASLPAPKRARAHTAKKAPAQP